MRKYEWNYAKYQMNHTFDELRELIEEHRQFVDFASYGEGTSPEWIKTREKELGVEFPPSYVWWLANYGGGEIFGEEVYSVYELPLSDINGCDIASINLKQGALARGRLYICQPGNDEFYFNLRCSTKSGEIPVFHNDLTSGTDSLYSETFAGFLSKRIKEFAEGMKS